ncbi:hypothetical protein LBMAG42_30150 [Deltaproteobacteria bacterium]|nr:hypothetical protein LBMAG42_30150 [Deltaproteobacteria bacterium]
MNPEIKTFAALLLISFEIAACRPRAAPLALVREADSSAPTSAAEPSGSFTNGTWTDARFPWSLHVPPGWDVLPGAEGSNPRLTLVHTESRARVEVSASPNGILGPRARRGCTWAFEDVGGYRALAVPGQVKVATCSPEDARDARVLGYFIVDQGIAYDIEAVLPPGRLLEGKEVTDTMVGGFRLRRGAP